VIEPPLTHEDVEGVYAGLRPLLSGESESTSQLSREHAVAHTVPGLVVIAGGKYTTYRVMAKDAVDAVVHGIPRKVPRSCTDTIPLVGAPGYAAVWNQRERLARDSGLHTARIEHLLGRYGSLVDELLELVKQQPHLGEPLDGAPTYLRVEAYYAALAEGALHLDDVLTRRTRISIETPDRGVKAAEEVAELVAPVLGWDESHVADEVDHYRKRVEAEIDSQAQPDDRTADAARLGAPDVRRMTP
ncbi:MAG: glycerol-3-phosphate dehydrogenase C-terminal domain-containing protein, partial [Nocardioidaceae bacterium]